MEPKWLPHQFLPEDIETVTAIITHRLSESKETILWKDILTMAKDDAELQELINHVKLHYYLKKDNHGEK